MADSSCSNSYISRCIYNSVIKPSRLNLLINMTFEEKFGLTSLNEKNLGEQILTRLNEHHNNIPKVFFEAGKVMIDFNDGNHSSLTIFEAVSLAQEIQRNIDKAQKYS